MSYIKQLYLLRQSYSLRSLKNNVKAHKIIKTKTFKLWDWNIKTLKDIISEEGNLEVSIFSWGSIFEKLFSYAFWKKRRKERRQGNQLNESSRNIAIPGDRVGNYTAITLKNKTGTTISVESFWVNYLDNWILLSTYVELMFPHKVHTWYNLSSKCRKLSIDQPWISRYDH